MSDVKEMKADALEGLNALYRQYARWLDGRLRAHVDPEQAADVVQETYLRAAPYSAGLIRHPRAFLLRIAMNVVRDESRRRKRRGTTETFTEAADPGEAADQVEALMMKQAVLTMPPLYREVFVHGQSDPGCRRRPLARGQHRPGPDGPRGPGHRGPAARRAAAELRRNRQ